MLIGFAIVAVSMLGFAGYNFLRGGIIKSFSMLVFALLSSFFAFGFYEMLSALLIKASIERVDAAIPYLPAISFIVIFALSFSVMQVLIIQLMRYEVKFDKAAEYTGNITLGILTGYIVSGVLLVFLALMPLPGKFPYPRFDENNPSPDRPKKVFLNPDGFITYLFGRISSGSFSTFVPKASFAAVHPNFIDQLHLNKLGVSKDLKIISTANEITEPSGNNCWNAPKELKDSDGKNVEPRGGFNLLIVRTGIIKLSAYENDISFSFSQVRLLCSQKVNGRNKLSYSGQNFYPLGYLKSNKQVQRAKIAEKITLSRDEINDSLAGGQGKWMDFVFEVPNNMTPYAIAFRQNSIAAVSPPVSAEKGLAAIPAQQVIPLSQCAQDYADIEPMGGISFYGTALTAKGRLLEDLPLSIPNEEEWNKLYSDSSISKAQFSEGQITFVRAELRLTGPAAAAGTKALNNISALLKPMDGFNILALKCRPPENIPSVPQQLPVLVENNGRTHQPVGIIISGMSGADKIYQVDYCSLNSLQNAEGLVIGARGEVTQPFFKNIWIRDKTENIVDCYGLYLVKPADDVFITEVKPAGSPQGAKFVGYQAFIVR